MTSITFAAVNLRGWRSSFCEDHVCTWAIVNYVKLGILEMTDVYQCGKVDFLFVSSCLQNNLFFARNFVQLPGWNRFELLPFLFHCCFRSLKSSSLKGMGINLWVSELNPLSAMWSSWFLESISSKRFLIDSWASTTQAYFVFLRGLLFSLATVSRNSLKGLSHQPGGLRHFADSNSIP